MITQEQRERALADLVNLHGDDVPVWGAEADYSTILHDCIPVPRDHVVELIARAEITKDTDPISLCRHQKRFKDCVKCYARIAVLKERGRIARDMVLISRERLTVLERIAENARERP